VILALLCLAAFFTVLTACMCWVINDHRRVRPHESLVERVAGGGSVKGGRG
jgi:hypothetical protein